MLIKQLRRLRPLRIDYYVLGEVFGPFLAGLILFTFVFIMFQALRLAEFFIIHGVAASVLGKLTFLLVLTSLPIALPVAFLLGVLVGFGRLSADSELVAMKANGISIGRLAAPVVALSIVVASLSLALNMEWVPWSHRSFKLTLTQIANTKVVSSIKEGTFTTGFYDLLIYADRLDNTSNRLHRVFIYDEREPKSPLTVVAREGEIVPVQTGSNFAPAAVLKLYDGNIHRHDVVANTYQKINFGEYRLFLKVDEGESGAVIKPGMVAYGDLVKQMKDPAEKPKRRVELTIEFWRRVAFAISPLGFVFLGIGLGTIRTRAVRAGAGLTGVTVVMIFWLLQMLGTVLAQKGMLPPALALQVSNLIVWAVGLRAFQLARW